MMTVVQFKKKLNQLTSEVNRIGNTTEFNTQKLIKWWYGVLQIGAKVTQVLTHLLLLLEQLLQLMHATSVTVDNQTVDIQGLLVATADDSWSNAAVTDIGHANIRWYRIVRFSDINTTLRKSILTDIYCHQLNYFSVDDAALVSLDLMTVLEQMLLWNVLPRSSTTLAVVRFLHAGETLNRCWK